MFYKEGIVVLVYVDACVIISLKEKAIIDFIESLKVGPEKFTLTDKGDIKAYLGMDFVFNKDGSFEMRQPFLIQKILDLVGLDGNASSRPTPSILPLLHKDVSGIERHQQWSYRSAVGMLTYLQGTSRPDISMSVHQCARFNNNPMLSHERTIKRIVRYLAGTKTHGVIIKPDKTKGIECYVDADFAGG